MDIREEEEGLFDEFTTYEIAHLMVDIRLFLSGDRRDLTAWAEAIFGEMARSDRYRDKRPCYRMNSFELHIGDRVELYHPFASTIITRGNIIYYDIDGDKSEHELNDENLFKYVMEVLWEL
jgi:hypothetical protein